MKVNFEVHGASAAELKEEADRVLALLDPEARWKVGITVTPMIEQVAGEAPLVWKGEVDAYDLTAGQY